MQLEKFQQIDQLDLKMRAIAEIRQDLARDVEAIQTLLRSENSGDEQSQSGSLAKLGFRDAVREILRDAPRGFSTGEIRKQLLSRGYVYTAGTPFPVRISNEMRRMKQQGMMDKHGKNYILTEKGRAM